MRWRSTPTVVAACLLALSAGAAALVLTGNGHSLATAATAAGVATEPASPPPPPPPELRVDGATPNAAGEVHHIDWDTPLAVTLRNATLSSVQVTGPDGPLAGQLSGDGWTAAATLLPLAAYDLRAAGVTPDGQDITLSAQIMTVPADRVVHATITPGDGEVVGVGEPVVIYLDHRMRTIAQRRELQARLSVRSVPAVTGAWHWVSQTEVHYRPESYWPAGAHVTTLANLTRLHLSGTRTWGSGRHSSSYWIGSSLVSTVDVAAHTMTVRRNGAVLRVLPVSTGRDKYPTKGGVHIVLEKQADQVFDSSTVGIPTASPDGYFEHLPWSVRISDGGAFVHANPGTVQFQGVSNVSHGCVNLSVADAEWYFHLAKRGDVVDVIHAAVGPVLYDPGMTDWNESFERWRSTGLIL